MDEEEDEETETEDETVPEEEKAPEADKKDEVPDTGEQNSSMYAIILMLVSALGICFTTKKEK